MQQLSFRFPYIIRFDCVPDAIYHYVCMECFFTYTSHILNVRSSGFDHFLCVAFNEISSYENASDDIDSGKKGRVSVFSFII